MSRFHAVLPILRTINAATFPGITHESRVAVQQLLEDNRKYHIYFNDDKFHNHVVHHLLDAYALGCSANRLHEIYKEHLPIQRPAPPKKIQITQSNWRDYLEDEDRWTDYVDFFASEVTEHGIDEIVNKYFFQHELFARFFSGVNHALIHLGFGVEFQEPLIVAEGLALAALSGDLEFVHLPPATPNGASLANIIEQVQADKQLDKIINPKSTTNERFKALRADKSVLQDYVCKWTVKEEDIAAREKELFEMIVLMYAAPVRPGKNPKFDFCSMHALTGSVFVHELLQHISHERGAELLRAHFGVALMYYIATGRPKLHIENLKNYKTKLPASSNPWLDIVKFGIETNDVHATKVVYSLLQYEAWFGEFEGIFLKAAQMTADAIRRHPNDSIVQDDVWPQSGVGFDHTWA